MNDTTWLLEQEYLSRSLVGSDAGPCLPPFPFRMDWEAYHLNFQYHQGHIPDQQKLRNGQWQILKGTLPDPRCRNLWLFAHGSSSSMGGDWEVPEYPGGSYTDISHGSTAFISAAQVQRLLGNDDVTFDVTSRRYAYSAPQHPFRFVFLDGCASASSQTLGDDKLPLWPLAFGIEPVERPLSWYQNEDGEWNIRPSAYCGWAIPLPMLTGLGGPVDPYQVQFRIMMTMGWRQFKASLDETFQSACNAFTPGEPSVPGVPKDKAFADLLRDNFVITGYKGIKFYQYNQRDIDQELPE